MQYLIKYIDRNVFLTRECKHSFEITNNCIFHTYIEARTFLDRNKLDSRLRPTYRLKFFKVVGFENNKILEE